MPQPGEKRSVEREIEDLRASIEKHLAPEAHVSTEAVTDLTNAIRDLSDHVAGLQRRIERIEDTHEEWTTRGWIPPPGSDSPP
jgi:hypothetical protein